MAGENVMLAKALNGCSWIANAMYAWYLYATFAGRRRM